MRNPPAVQREWQKTLGLFGLVLLLAVALPVPDAAAGACPTPVAKATRLFVGVAPDMRSSRGVARLYFRNRVDEPWQTSGSTMPVTLGRNGLGWNFAQTGLAGIAASDAGPVKVEGDGKTAAGLFPAGRPFGFKPGALKDYLRIVTGTICVDDPASADYNTVLTPKKIPPGVSHENMWEIALYRAGIDIVTPTSRSARSGSCIFLHVWRDPDSATSGCVGASEANVVRVQHVFDGEPSAFALLPRSSLGVLGPCGLPEGQDQAGATAKAARDE